MKVKTILYIGAAGIVVIGIAMVSKAVTHFNPITAAMNTVSGVVSGFFGAYTEALDQIRPPAVPVDPSNPYGISCPAGTHPTIFGDCVSDAALYPKPIGGGR